jgi:hypothetical protein
MRAHFQREPEAEWTGYNSSLERPLLNSKRFLEKKKAADGNGVAAAGNGTEAEENSSAATAGEE